MSKSIVAQVQEQTGYRSVSTDKLALLMAGMESVDKEVIRQILEGREVDIKLTWTTVNDDMHLPEVSIKIK